MATVSDYRPGTEAAPEHRSLTLSRAALATLILAFAAIGAAGVELSLRTQAGIYLVGMVALNLPHGGYEHFANLRRRALSVRGRYVAAYLALVAAFVGLFLVEPVAGLAVAIGVACTKGGLGGVHVLDATTGTDHLETRLQRWLAAAVRGGSVMVVPLVVQSATFHGFSSVMVNVFETGGLAPYAASFDLTRPLFAAGFGLAAVAHVGLGYVRGGGRSWLIDAGETALLIAYFAVVPVVVAVGLYFPLWYSARQVARAAAVETPDGDGPDLLDAGDAGTTAMRAWLFLVAGALATAGVVAAVWLVAPNPLGHASLLPGLVAFWSIAISIVALPHVLVGSVLDRDRGIWYVP